MGSRTAYFVIAVCILVASLITIASYYVSRTRRVSRDDWPSLVKRLVKLDRDSIEIIASDHEHTINQSRIFKMIGGMQGLEALEINCSVLIDLTCHVQKWYPEALVVAEELRLNAREIQWHLGRLRGAASPQNMQENFAEYAQGAVAIYYRMTRTVLTLYQQTNCAGLADLEQYI